MILNTHISLLGVNVEEAFLRTAKQIYQNIQDGSLDLNAAESGVQVSSISIQLNSSNHRQTCSFKFFFLKQHKPSGNKGIGKRLGSATGNETVGSKPDCKC